MENCSGSFVQEAFVFVAGLLIVFTNSGTRSLVGINLCFHLLRNWSWNIHRWMLKTKPNQNKKHKAFGAPATVIDS